ncbi:MAG: AgmX/PglI C-terminal domain-containing protein [bacterium]
MANRAKASKSTRRCLRVGIVQGGRIIEERHIRHGKSVSIGQSPRNHFTVSAPQMPRAYQAFRIEGGKHVLRFPPGMDGRISVDGRVITLTQAVEAGLTRQAGAWRELALRGNARGKLNIGDVSVLFQRIRIPPKTPQPRLPQSLQGGITHRLDTGFSMVISGAVALAAAFLITVQLVPRPANALRSSRIRTLLSDNLKAMHKAPAPKPASVSTKRNNSKINGEPVAAPTEPLTQDHPHRTTRTGPAKPLQKVRKGTAEYRALLGELTQEIVGSGRDDKMASIAIAGECKDPKGCKNSLYGLDRLRHANPGDLDDAASSTHSIGPGDTDGPGSHRRKRRAFIGGRPTVTTTRTDPDGVPPVLAPMHPTQIPVKPPTFEKPVNPIPKAGAGISAKVKARVYGLKYCYQRAVLQNRTLKGSARISFVIQPNGRVRGVRLRSDLGGSVTSCLRAEVSRWHLGKLNIQAEVFYGPFMVKFTPRD